ncbi:MAG: AraC family transcriptional regulator ligand-binding domain-containing protein [Pseudomonadota bacterium]
MDDRLYTRTEPVLLPLYPRLIMMTLLELGFDEAQIFAGLDLQAAQLQDEHYRLSIEQHEQFILRAIEITANPHLALVLNRQRAGDVNNLPLLAVANSGQIAKALDLMIRYLKIVTRVFSVRSFVTDEDAVMEVEVHLEHPQVVYFAVSSFALFIDHFFHNAVHGEHLVQRVELTIPTPAGFTDIREQFPFALAFGQPKTKLQFAVDLLDKPMQQADPQTVRLLLEMSERQLDEAEAETTLVGAVKSLLIEQIAAPPRLDQAARDLGLSSRSLRRKLAQSGTSYQKILDDIRLKMASRLLRETSTPVASIAYELGFANASDFGRAFRKWSGLAPTALRRR